MFLPYRTTANRGVNRHNTKLFEYRSEGDAREYPLAENIELLVDAVRARMQIV